MRSEMSKKWTKKIVISFIVSLISVSLIVVLFQGHSQQIMAYSEKGIISDNIVLGWIVNIFLGIIMVILSIIWDLLEFIIQPIMNAFQDAIFIVLSGEVINQALNISYSTWIWVAGTIFLICGFIYLVFVVMVKHNSPKSTFLNLVKGILALILFPIAYSLLYYFFSWFSTMLNTSSLNEMSIYDILTEYTFDMIGIIGNRWVQFSLVIVSAISVILIFKWFIEFIIAIIIRTYELIVFGVIGLGFSASAMTSDGGKRLSVYNSIMLTKIVSVFLLFLGYLIVISFLPAINRVIAETHFVGVHSDEGYINAILIFSFDLASFWMLKSLSTEWAFMISGDSKGALATQLNQAGSTSMMVMIPIKKMKSSALSYATAGISNVAKVLNKTKKAAGSYDKIVGNKKGKEKEGSKSEWYDKWEKNINSMRSRSNDNLDGYKANSEEGNNEV